MLHDEEILVAYNISTNEVREELVTVGNRGTGDFRFIYGDTGKVHVVTNVDINKNFVKLKLNPMQFVILTNN